MKRIVLACALVFGLVFLFSVHAQTVPTNIGVSNSPPLLIQNFSDIFILLNESLLNFLDLDDYFIDPNGDSLTFTHSNISNLTILVDSNNSVSFIPDADFIGVQTLVFYAFDNSTNTSSNNFSITVGQDTQAPLWSNPGRNRQNIYQNYFVNFSTTWTDNLALANFTFSIDQGSGFASSPTTNFTGTSNISIENVQISAAGGQIVYWRFSAIDESGNSNTTATQNFTVSDSSSNTGSGTSSTTGTGRATGVEETIQAGSDAPSFEVEPKNLRVSLRQGDTLTRVVKIRNIGNRDLVFSAALEGIPGLALLGEEAFEIPSSDSYDLLVEFTIPSDATPDQYFGSLVLKSSRTIIVPIVLDVRKFDAEIQVNVSVLDEFRFVRAGEVVQAKITIQNVKDVREAPAELFYAIKDFQGNILESVSEEITLYASFDENRELLVPPGDYQGEHIFYARVLSNDIVDLDSDTFFIGSRLKLLYWLDRLFYPILILILLLIIFLLIWVRERNRRKKKLLELYLLLNELRTLVEKGKMESALAIYKKVKVIYGQHIPKSYIKDKEKLRLELEKFSKLLQKVKKPKPKENTEKKDGQEGEQKESSGDAAKTEEKAVAEPKETETPKEEQKPATQENTEQKEASTKETKTKSSLPTKPPKKTVEKPKQEPLPKKSVAKKPLPKEIVQTKPAQKKVAKPLPSNKPAPKASQEVATPAKETSKPVVQDKALPKKEIITPSNSQGVKEGVSNDGSS